MAVEAKPHNVKASDFTTTPAASELEYQSKVCRKGVKSKERGLPLKFEAACRIREISAYIANHIDIIVLQTQNISREYYAPYENISIETQMMGNYFFQIRGRWKCTGLTTLA